MSRGRRDRRTQGQPAAAPTSGAVPRGQRPIAGENRESPAAAPARRWPLPVLPWPALLGLVLLAVVWLQRAALRMPFFADDFLFLDQVRYRSPWGALTSPDPLGNFVRPVGRQLHFWLWARAGGETPLVFHLANLALFLGAVALLFVVARRLAGPVAGAVAAAFLALHYAADVPLMWACGSQDLLALTGALGALALHLAGRRALAALALLAGMLSKETVVFLPVVAALADRRPGESWRRGFARAWPLGLAVAAWAGLWLLFAGRSAGMRGAVTWSAGGVAATFAHLLQVALGLEWRGGAGARFLGALPPLVPLAIALAAIALAGHRARPGRRGLLVGLAWALLGTVPVAAVASAWSAYYYLFALCGVALLLGTWLAGRPRELALVAVLLLAWGSENGRRLDEFITAPGAWTTQSHVNRFYVQRGTRNVERYLAQMRRLRPTLPPRSTVFFGGLPSFVAFQVGDGPLVRWAYRDTSLRSYYLMQFSVERFRRGPAIVMAMQADTLAELALDRLMLRSFAVTALVAGRPAVARDLMSLPEMWTPTELYASYWRAWPALALGDTAGAYGELRRAGMVLDRGPAPEIPQVMRRIAAGDTAGAVRILTDAMCRHVLDAEVHALVAALLVNDPDRTVVACLEAYAATVLGPDVARHWWLLGFAQTQAKRFDEAQRSVERFFAMGGGEPGENAQARHLLDWLRERAPGGRLRQQSLRR